MVSITEDIHMEVDNTAGREICTRANATSDGQAVHENRVQSISQIESNQNK